MQGASMVKMQAQCRRTGATAADGADPVGQMAQQHAREVAQRRVQRRIAIAIAIAIALKSAPVFAVAGRGLRWP